MVHQWDGFLNILALKLLYVCPREHGETRERRHGPMKQTIEIGLGSGQYEKIKTKIKLNSERLGNP